MDNFRLVDVLDIVRDAIVAEFEAAGIALPASNHYQHGTPVIDCPATLAISITSLYIGGPSGEVSDIARCVIERTVDINVQLWRCVPTPDGAYMPTDAELNTSALELFEDCWVLSESMLRAAYALKAELDPVGIGAVTPLEPDGGSAGWQSTLRVGVEARG